MFPQRSTLSVFVILSVLCFTISKVQGDLDKDNPSHRGFSNKLDDKFGGNAAYDRLVRPVVHGTYHAGRFLNSRNPEEWARSKDQFSKFGTGQQRTDYLRAHRNH